MAPTENKKKTAKDVLFEYVQNKNKSFYWYHNPDRINQYRSNKNYSKTGKKIKKDDGQDVVIHKCLYDFFDATLDEVRLKKANDFSTAALKISDNGLLAYFREAASKREFAADIDYNMQRDHAAHTLYNYILGWYFFDYSKAFSEAFKVHLVGKKEKLIHKSLLKDPNDLTPLLKNPNDNTIDDDDGDKYGGIDKNTKILANEFGDVWSITSLLHDIGYILEGKISPASIEVENIRVSRGSKLIHDYFNHRFWNRTEIDFRAVQGIAAVLKVSIPDFRRSQSLSSLGDHLCNIGFCENIRKNLKECDGFESLNELRINEPYGLNCNAFSLWETYYKVYADDTNEFYIKNGKPTKMERILDIVKNEYNDAIWKGSNQGYRNLNHGVCSGLIALKALSFFYDFVYGFKRFDTWEKYSNKYDALIDQGHLNEVDKVSKQSYEETKLFITEKNLPEQIKLRNGDYGRNADFWFNKVLWATASVAIHDVIQKKYYETICKKHDKKHDEKTGVLKIGINDDPLAFLGVLVDALQEWDRYTVLGESAFTDTEPLQSTEVDLLFKSNNEPIHLNYPKKNGSRVDFSGDIEKVLNGCLENWKGIVTIAEKILCPHCDEPLAERSYQSSEIVIEHDYKAFECGRVIVDGKVTVECKNIVESSTT